MPAKHRLHSPDKNILLCSSYLSLYKHSLNFLHSIPASPASVSDQELVTRFKVTGDLTVLSDLFQRYMDLLYGVCLKYLKEPALAQDAVMGVYETLILQLPKHEVAFFRAWVYQVTRNYCLMQLRKESRGPKMTSLPDMELAADGHQGETTEKEFRLTRMEACLETLSPEQKHAVALFYLEEKCYNDIVAQTGLDWNRVRSLIQNGKRNLKICMEKPFPDEIKSTGTVNK